jgi:hypothetical protein
MKKPSVTNLQSRGIDSSRENLDTLTLLGKDLRESGPKLGTNSLVHYFATVSNDR